MINNRQQNGRRRGRGGQRTQSGGNPGRGDNGNRIDSRARGNASQLYEKYKSLASDAQRQGDRVNTEYYLQFADHYFRVLAESRSRFDEQQPRRQSNDPFDDGYDGDEEFGDEGEPVRADQYQIRPPEPRREEPPQGEPRRDDQSRGDGRGQNGDARRYEARPDRGDARNDNRGDARNDNRGDNRNDNRSDGRNDGRADYRGNDQRDTRGNRNDARGEGRDAPRSYNGNGGANGRSDNGYAAQPRDTPRYAADDQGDIEEAAPLAAAHVPAVAMASEFRAADGDAAPAPRKRGRPRKVIEAVAPAADPEPSGFDAALLPPSLSVSASAQPDADMAAGDEAKPRRRRGRPPGSGTVQAS